MFRAHVLIIRRSKLRYTAYRCDETKSCVMQFWPPDDEYMCSKHIETWNKLIVKQKFCASSWLITEINACSLFIITGYDVQFVVRKSSVGSHVLVPCYFLNIREPNDIHSHLTSPYIKNCLYIPLTNLRTTDTDCPQCTRLFSAVSSLCQLLKHNLYLQHSIMYT